MLPLIVSCSKSSKKNVSQDKDSKEVTHHRVIIIDEYADSIYYHGQWYYLDDYNLDWISKSGDHIKWHIEEPDQIVYYDKPIIIYPTGDTIGYEGGPTPARLDDYGDTIIYKHKDVYF